MANEQRGRAQVHLFADVGRFTAVLHAVAVPKGRSDLLAYVKAFVEDAKASGLVKGAIERAGVRGVQVAPPVRP